MIPAAFVLAGLAAVVGSGPGDPLEDLLAEVSEIASPGTPGNVVAFGPGAFVVIAGRGDVPVVAASEFGRGRAMIFGHTGYLGASVLGIADTGTFYRNALRWLGGGKRKPAIACPGSADLAAGLEDLGLRADAKMKLEDADVVVLKARAFSAQEVELYTAFVQRGGGLITTATGWGWQQLNPARTLARDLEVNHLTVPLGLAFGTSTVSKTGAVGFLTQPRPSQWSHAGRAFAGLRDGGVPDDGRALASARLRGAISALPDHEPSLILPLRAWVEAGGAPAAIADHYAKRSWRPLSVRVEPWRVIGPFRGGKTVRDSGPAEKSLRAMALDGPGPDLDGTLRGIGGRVPWRLLSLTTDGRALDEGEVRFERVLAPPDKEQDWTSRATAYAYRAIEVTEPTELPLRLGVDDAARVWVNAELVEERVESEGIVVGESDFVLRLSPGRNHLLVKVRNDQGIWGFRMREATTLTQAQVNTAVDAGVAWILERQLIDGSWPNHSKYGVGYSAYAVYTLIKSGVDSDHPAVKRGMAYVRAHEGDYTYSTACRILALAAHDRGDSLGELQQAVDKLAMWQADNGLYGYPVYPGGGVLPPDLSNSLYVALALRSAEKRGARVPPRTWRELLEGALRCWENSRSTKARRDNEAGGFSYRVAGSPNGSMTTAGLSVIAMATQALGPDFDKRDAKKAQQALDAGLEWLEREMTWRENPAGSARWQYFFLYGIERVGALLKLDVLGKVNWYWSGAEYLVGAQDKDGSWKGSGSESGDDTILALLFLNKATAPTTGRGKITDRQVLDASGDVSVRAVGNDPLDVWITGVADSLPVQRVEWVVRDSLGVERVAARVEANLDRDGALQRHAARLTFGAPGSFEVFARVTALRPHAEPGFDPTPVTLLSPPLALTLDAGSAAPFAAYARDAGRNLLRGVVVEASSAAGGQEAAKAVDGAHGSRWACAKNDKDPRWKATLTPAREANALQVSHGWPLLKERGKAQAARLEVVINGTQRFDLVTDEDPHAKSILTLPDGLRVSTVELRVVEARNAKLGGASLGFSEVELIAAE